MMKTQAGMALATMLLVLAPARVPAQSSGGPYRIKASVIAGGGRPIAAGPFQITGTIGQAATSTLAGGGHVLFDGFWAPVGGVQGDRIFTNGFDAP